MTFRILLLLFLVCVVPLRASAQDRGLTLLVPQAMLDNGFTKHLLPRFGFKTRIRIVPTSDPDNADLAFVTEAGEGAPVFQTADGIPLYLVARSEVPETQEKIAKFRDWLESVPGKAAIEGYPAGGPALYGIGAADVAAAVDVVVEGDVAAGSKLALFHCGRCHVVDQRNKMGGIGSSPSFSALRGRVGWSDLFLAFWAENPHPSFTQVEGVTEPFSKERPSHIAPVEITLEEIEAITAFVATIEPKDLGAQVAPK